MVFSISPTIIRKISSSQKKIIALHIKESNVCSKPLSLLCFARHKTPVFAVETPHNLTYHIALPSSFIITLDLMGIPNSLLPLYVQPHKISENEGCVETIHSILCLTRKRHMFLKHLR